MNMIISSRFLEKTSLGRFRSSNTRPSRSADGSVATEAHCERKKAAQIIQPTLADMICLSPGTEGDDGASPPKVGKSPTNNLFISGAEIGFGGDSWLMY
jgi:hypothetical protein